MPAYQVTVQAESMADNASVDTIMDTNGGMIIGTIYGHETATGRHQYTVRTPDLSEDKVFGDYRNAVMYLLSSLS